MSNNDQSSNPPPGAPSDQDNARPRPAQRAPLPSASNFTTLGRAQSLSYRQEDPFGPNQPPYVMRSLSGRGFLLHRAPYGRMPYGWPAFVAPTSQPREFEIVADSSPQSDDSQTTGDWAPPNTPLRPRVRASASAQASVAPTSQPHDLQQDNTVSQVNEDPHPAHSEATTGIAPATPPPQRARASTITFSRTPTRSTSAAALSGSDPDSVSHSGSYSGEGWWSPSPATRRNIWRQQPTTEAAETSHRTMHAGSTPLRAFGARLPSIESAPRPLRSLDAYSAGELLLGLEEASLRQAVPVGPFRQATHTTHEASRHPPTTSRAPSESIAARRPWMTEEIRTNRPAVFSPNPTAAELANPELEEDSEDYNVEHGISPGTRRRAERQMHILVEMFIHRADVLAGPDHYNAADDSPETRRRRQRVFREMTDIRRQVAERAAVLGCPDPLSLAPEPLLPPSIFGPSPPGYTSFPGFVPGTGLMQNGSQQDPQRGTAQPGTPRPFIDIDIDMPGPILEPDVGGFFGEPLPPTPPRRGYTTFPRFTPNGGFPGFVPGGTGQTRVQDQDPQLAAALLHSMDETSGAAPGPFPGFTDSSDVLQGPSAAQAGTSTGGSNNMMTLMCDWEEAMDRKLQHLLPRVQPDPSRAPGENTTQNPPATPPRQNQGGPAPDSPIACQICYNELEIPGVQAQNGAREPMVVMPCCGNQVGSVCLGAWKNGLRGCPFCRASLATRR